MNHHHKRIICGILFLALCCSIAFTALPVVRAEETTDPSKIRDLYMPDTKVVNPPTVVQNVDTSDKLNNLNGDIRPQAAWLTLTSDAKVQLGSANVTLTDALNACPRVLPILVIPDTACAELVIAAVKNIHFDLLLASSNTEVLKKLYNDQIPYTRLIYITDASDPKTITETALSNGAMIVAMANPSRETCEYLQKRFLTVLTNPALANDELNVRSAVDCGANFVLLDGYQKAYEMYEAVQSPAYVRRSYVVGHRGMVSLAPDNTAEGVREAFENGADAAEIDIRYTSDQQIVCFHNNDLKGATVETLETPDRNISEYSYAELQQYTLKMKGQYANCKIPTLEEILTVLQEYPDKILVIEFKDFLVDPDHLRTVLEQFNVMDRCVFIGFGQNLLNMHYPTIPTVGASLLDSGYPQDDATGCVDRYYSVSIGTVASYSPSYYIPDAAIGMLHCRGVSLNLWTAGSFSVMVDMAYRGAQFITTDLVEEESWVHDCYNNMDSNKIFGAYVEPASSTPPAADSSQDSVTNPFSIMPLFFVLPALAFIAAIIAKIYHIRKK